jgi:RNA polymerase sigma-70 factor (sigma-E family)
MDDEDGFVEFLSVAWPRLYRLAFLLTGSDADAEDLTQTAFEKICTRWSRVRDVDQPVAYACSVLMHQFVSRRRRRSASEVPRENPPDVGAPSREGDLVEHLTLWPLVCALPARQRATIVLRYYEDLSEAQTAEALGCSVGAVKAQAHDAREALRRGLGAHEVGRHAGDPGDPSRKAATEP